VTREQFNGQVDVFTAIPFKGNPLAVVVGADGLSDDAMQTIANWTNLSETTFLCRPTEADADYRVRIFTPERELPFAGHPTLGTCAVWLGLGNTPKRANIVQQCGVGLVRIKRDGDQRLAFAAPPQLKSGPVDADLLARIARSLGITREAIKASQWIDNGPGWVGVMLGSRAEVLAIKRDLAALPGQPVGVVAPCDPKLDDIDTQFEVRAFVGRNASEDPVTGSLNASLAQWLIGTGIAPPRYVASQGTAIGRAGRIHVAREGDDIWIGGDVAKVVEGTISI
jgi:PhzF family phenazine biosynthesis protein